MPIYRQTSLLDGELPPPITRFYAITGQRDGYVNLRITVTTARSTDILGQEHYELLSPAEALDVINAQEGLFQ